MEYDSEEAVFGTTPSSPPRPMLPYLTPNSPKSPGSRENADRFIPSRLSEAFTRKQLFSPSSSLALTPESFDTPKSEEATTYKLSLRNELLKENNLELPLNNGHSFSDNSVCDSPVLKYTSPVKQHSSFKAPIYGPVSPASKKLLQSPRKVTRKIPKIPYRVLDAPDLQDDFYLNLLDWSSQNVLAVGLGPSVYLWNAGSGQVTKLCDMNDNDLVTAVAWSERGQYLAVGTDKGHVNIWDTTSISNFATLSEHLGRVGSLAWNGDYLASGSRDRTICIWDHQRSHQPLHVLSMHQQEVCGLRWSHDRQMLASGGNDNKLFVWHWPSISSLKPVYKFADHMAAVKALSWSPQCNNLLASGGGTADKTIRFWNTTTGQQVQHLDTGSQVCNLAWSSNGHELVSTHGYSQNHITVWRYPSMSQIAKLTGHTKRVLYMATSPDGENIVTGAGDETLRFWQVFSKVNFAKENVSLLNAMTYLR